MPPVPVSETEITKVLSQLLFGDDMRKYNHNIAGVSHDLVLARLLICNLKSLDKTLRPMLSFYT